MKFCKDGVKKDNKTGHVLVHEFIHDLVGNLPVVVLMLIVLNTLQ